DHTAKHAPNRRKMAKLRSHVALARKEPAWVNSRGYKLESGIRPCPKLPQLTAERGFSHAQVFSDVYRDCTRRHSCRRHHCAPRSAWERRGTSVRAITAG